MGSMTNRGKDRHGLDVWELRISLPFDPETGTYPSYSERFHGPAINAKRRLRDLELDHDEGRVRRAQVRLVGDYLAQWLESLPAKDLAARTRAEYARQTRTYLIPLLGRHRLRTLTEEDVSRMIATLVQRGLSPASVQKAKTTLGSALTDAVRAGHIPRNVTHGAPAPKVRKRRMVTLGEDETEQLLAAIAADAPWHALVLTAVTTGMRRGELLALRRGDVDLLAGTISVVSGLDEGEDGIVVGDTKEDSSRRLIRLHPMTVQCLAQYDLWLDERRRKYGDRWEDNDLMFPATRTWRYRGKEMCPGRYLMPHSVTQHWDETRRSGAAPREMRFHDLRHTHATQLLRAGVNVKVVSERLGHADVAITLQTYAHVLPDMQQSAVDALDWLVPKD